MEFDRSPRKELPGGNMTRRAALARLLAVSLSPLAVGCGASGFAENTLPGGGTTNVVVPVQFDALDPSNPIRSVELVLKGGGTLGQDITTVVNRTSDLAQTATAFLPDVKSGSWMCIQNFVTLADGAGNLVAQAADLYNVVVQLNNSGGGCSSSGSPATPVDSTQAPVAASGAIVSLRVLPRQTVKVGQAIPLLFSAHDAAGRLVATRVGTASFHVDSGGDVLQINQQQQAVGLAAGTAGVTVAVGSLTSDIPEAVVVTA